ncbi:tail assembly protein [Salmonella enterica subsp. enterica]|uniref:Tail assembly protein n=1 Tax=Salmonella enterica I TaxID=59201 RepID=A0A447MUP4_SALET|nr:tail assembly protein [Salmonella enterica subsp. enterica]
MATTDTLNMAAPAMVRICLYGDLQRFGKRISLSIKTAAEGIHALAIQLPGFRQRMNEGWYQVRIAGSDMAPDTLTARLNESLPPGAVVHIVPRMAGAKNGIWQGGSRGSADWRVIYSRSECCSGGSIVFRRNQYGAGWCGADADTCTQNTDGGSDR